MNLQLGGQLGTWLLQHLSKRPPEASTDLTPAAGVQGAAKLERLLGREVWSEFAGQRVLDFGCGHGAEAVAVAVRGVECVFGVDTQQRRLETARQHALASGVASRCVFLNANRDVDTIAQLEGTIDVAYSLDSFEHYARPDLVLKRFHELLRPGGRLLISFGPPWKHPYGCHLRYFCHVPWIHLLFQEETVLAVRAQFRRDGARRFEDVDGGLNRMTLARFLQLVADSPFELDLFRPIPQHAVRRRPALLASAVG